VSATTLLASDDQIVLPSPAQTNLGLYKQAHAAGYAPDELAWLRDCYEFATSLFSGHLRASGKPFLSHLVGTASTLAALRAPAVAVGAGLLHAAYSHGDFGITRRRNRHRRVRAAIGEAAEALVWRYYEQPWNPSEISRLCREHAGLSQTDRLVVLMRLANELDDNLDLAELQGHEDRAFRDSRDDFVALACAFGYPGLANALLAAYRDADEGSWAAALSLDRAASYQLASSFGMRLLRPTRTLLGLAQSVAHGIKSLAGRSSS
jgi:(p)ppGpp synthase/HD superfamily hydrolase